MSFVKEHFFVNQQYEIQETEKSDRSSEDQQLNTLRFLKNFGASNCFCGHHILTECAFVTQLSSNAEISV